MGGHAGPRPSRNRVYIPLSWATGLYGRRYSGYFADNVSFFASATLSGTSKLYTSINSNWTEGGDSFSIEWRGYFRPNATGTWTFSTNSDDASYIWIGPTALSGFTTGNPVVNNGGAHAPQVRTGTISLTFDEIYPIRIHFGEQSGGEVMVVSFTPPGGSSTSDGTGFYFYNTLTNGF